MKYALAVSLLLMSVSAMGQSSKPYARTKVRIVSSWVNRHQLRIIDAVDTNDENIQFSFDCNADICNAPRVKGVYELIIPPFRAYECDEYYLEFVRNKMESFPVCLSDVR